MIKFEYLKKKKKTSSRFLNEGVLVVLSVLSEVSVLVGHSHRLGDIATYPNIETFSLNFDRDTKFGSASPGVKERIPFGGTRNLA